MRSFLFTVCIVVGASHALSQSQPNNVTLPYQDVDAYKVYSAILPELPLWGRSKTLLIQLETNAPKYCGQPDEEAQFVVGTAIADYARLNQKSWSLENDFTIEKPYELVSSKNLSYSNFRTHNSPAWPYPDSPGFVIFSAVGFNPDKSVAVVAVTEAGPRASGGRFWVLEKSGSRWRPMSLKRGKFKEGCAWAA